MAQKPQTINPVKRYTLLLLLPIHLLSVSLQPLSDTDFPDFFRNCAMLAPASEDEMDTKLSPLDLLRLSTRKALPLSRFMPFRSFCSDVFCSVFAVGFMWIITLLFFLLSINRNPSLYRIVFFEHQSDGYK